MPAASLAEAEALALPDRDSEVETDARWLSEADRLCSVLWLAEAESEAEADVRALALSDADSETDCETS